MTRHIGEEQASAVMGLINGEVVGGISDLDIKAGRASFTMPREAAEAAVEEFLLRPTERDESVKEVQALLKEHPDQLGVATEKLMGELAAGAGGSLEVLPNSDLRLQRVDISMWTAWIGKTMGA